MTFECLPNCCDYCLDRERVRKAIDELELEYCDEKDVCENVHLFVMDLKNKLGLKEK